MEAIGLSLIAYLLGSISFAVVCSKLGHVADPRQSGSGNPGATNVLRLGGPKVAAVVLLGDAIKGLLPVVIGHLMGMGGLLLGLVGLAVRWLLLSDLARIQRRQRRGHFSRCLLWL